MKLTDIRRDNLRAFVKANGGSTAVSTRLGYRNASFLSQQIGPRPTREVTEKTARAVEAAYNLPAGVMDQPEMGTGQAVAAPGAAITTAMVSDVIRLVGSVLQAEGVEPVGPEKFANLVALALADAVEHAGQMRAGHIQAIARLMK